MSLRKSGGSRNLKGAEDNASASSSFIENAHNELYASYMGKGSLLQKNSEHIGAVGPSHPP